MKIAVYSGTFDPITNGHMSIIKRAIGLFDKVYIAVAEETYKNTLFDVEERVALVKESVADLENVEAEKFTGLLVDYAQSRGAVAIVRGLRVISDFEYEMQMASFNRHLNPHIETVFFTADGEFSMVSSSMIRNIASLHGDIQDFVPAPVYEALRKKY
ncbi:MAG: pantetheine-phosphate adenylyltransferase [Peptococcaceae bacterium]|nr:pantetheine-phosphate adenylyltransferase [Peptococcaceae bacterium]